MEVKLPRTATRRGAVCFIKLLVKVDPKARDGFGYDGKLYRPGQQVQREEMGERPILLEVTDSSSLQGGARKIYLKLYILWRLQEGQWIEILRTEAQAGEWAEMLRETARVALGRASWAVAPRVADVVTRIRTLLDDELGPLELGQRSQVLAELHDQFAMRIVDTMSA